MNTADLLSDAFGRIQAMVRRTVTGLTPDQLTARPDPEANSIAWLVWHLTRIQDDHVADAAGIEQVWTAEEWSERFALPFDPSATGYGQSADDVGAVRVPASDLIGYHDAVHVQTIGYVTGLRDADLDRIVDQSWDPPVSLGVRLVSVVTDNIAHAGQAAYVRGLLERVSARGTTG